MMSSSLSADRIGLITGASRGLGLALARELARAGWRLIIDARTAGELEQARAGLARWSEVVATTGDVSDPEHQQALTSAVARWGKLDLLVNNASILGPSPQPFLLEYPLEILEQVYRVNTLSPLSLIQRVRRYLSSNACIINIT